MTEQLKMICDRMVAEASPSVIVLYGKKHIPNSDALREANFCLVVRDDPKGVERRLYQALELDFPYNLLVYAEEDWRRLLTDPTSYATSIKNKGVVLYGKA